MEGKVERGFMITLHSFKRFNVLRSLIGKALLSIVILSCEPDLSDDPIPYVHFNDIVINLTLPEFSGLASDGGYKYVNGGVKGIIVYRKNSSTYIALERNCTFQPNDACATVEVDVTNSYIHNDGCCGSQFFFYGRVKTGPAWRPLQQYETLLSGGNTLTITDQVVQ
jgi:hypothetical protein